ncbi:MAG TPA: polysaccharide deacetylase family protein [Chitinophagaceae bacterium]|nr:polysaccharide deacetylase family protein [Chitinophagaceae bacterium]
MIINLLSIKKIFYVILFIASTYVAARCKGYGTEKNSKSTTTVSTNIVAVKSSADSAFTYDSTKKYVYFTFDDGPQPGTMNCFHTVKDLNVKASFFMIGVQIDNRNLQRKVDSIRNSYPQILLCNHSYTHANFNRYKSYYNNADSALQDVIKAQSSMQVPLKIFRTPANNSWDINGRLRSPQLTKQLCYLLNNAGYKVAGWDVEWTFKEIDGMIPIQSADRIIKDIEEAFNKDENFVHNNVVILTHDRMFQKPQYADSLRKVITTLKKDNQIVFETMDHYPGIRFK